MALNDGLSRRARERLKDVGELSDVEKRALADESALDDLLRRFYKDELTAPELLTRLRRYEQERNWIMLRSARDKLKSSFKWDSLGFTFQETPDGAVVLAEGAEPRVRLSDSTGAVLELTDATFDAAVKTNSLLVVDCWAAWCGPCRMVAPVIEELAGEYAGRVTFGKLDVDRNRAIASRYRIQSIPTILVFKDGRLVDQKLGALPRAVLEPAITRHLEAPPA